MPQFMFVAVGTPETLEDTDTQTDAADRRRCEEGLAPGSPLAPHTHLPPSLLGSASCWTDQGEGPGRVRGCREEGWGPFLLFPTPHPPQLTPVLEIPHLPFALIGEGCSVSPQMHNLQYLRMCIWRFLPPSLKGGLG